MAVAWVIRNRWVAHYAASIKQVCLAPLQFSCWNRTDPNLGPMLQLSENDPVFRRCLGIAALVISGDLPDYSHGATNYFSTSMPQPPEWANRMVPTVTLGRHKFLKEVR